MLLVSTQTMTLRCPHQDSRLPFAQGRLHCSYFPSVLDSILTTSLRVPPRSKLVEFGTPAPLLRRTHSAVSSGETHCPSGQKSATRGLPIQPGDQEFYSCLSLTPASTGDTLGWPKGQSHLVGLSCPVPIHSPLCTTLCGEAPVGIILIEFARTCL